MLYPRNNNDKSYSKTTKCQIYAICVSGINFGKNSNARPTSFLCIWFLYILMFLGGVICTNPFSTASFDRVFTSSQGINKLEWLLSKQSFWTIFLYHIRLRRENKIIRFTVTIDGDQFNYLESSKWGFALFAYIYFRVCLPSEAWRTFRSKRCEDFFLFWQYQLFRITGWVKVFSTLQ